MPCATPSKTQRQLAVFAIILIAISALPIWANAQNDSSNAPPTSASCKDNKDATAADFYGTWILELNANSESSSASTVQTTRLILKQNPEFAESLAGEFTLNSQRIEVFGDLENAVLDLEESDNGKDISALWKGRIAEGSCGKAVAGTRRVIATQVEQGFVLRRAGW